MTTIEQPDQDALELDPAIRPQDDLFGHVNGLWLDRTAIPDDRSTYGSFELVREQAELDVRQIIERAAAGEEPDADAKRIGDLYASFMDTAAVQSAGVAPLRPILDRVAAVQDVEDLLSLIGRLTREGIAGLFGTSVWVDKGDPTRYLIHIGQSGLGLPDESYYRAEEHAAIREAYVAHIARMLHLTDALVSQPDAAEAAAQIMSLETAIADAHWERSETRDAVRTYNLTTAADLRAVLPTVDDWMHGLGVTPEQWSEVVVGQPDVVEAMTALLTDRPLAQWQAWLAWRVVRSMAGYLTDEVVEANFDFYGRTLTGAPQLRERWKRGVSLVEGVLGELVGKLYVAEHYPPKSEAQMTVLVDHLIEAYRQRITDLDWMADDTRQRALGKLSAFTPKIGKPVRWKDYSDLEIQPDDLVGNVRRATAHATDRELRKLGGPVDRDEWFMTPQTVNAYYNPAMNEIVFPAAILQWPFFDPDRDPAYNYGAIGAVIGHEIGHGFDDQGSKYDGDGTLRDWWTPEDRARFDERTQALITQYGRYSPRDLPDSHTVNGPLTVGENIGDLGGVAVAHHAWRLFEADTYGGPAPEVDGLTGDQRFFVGWAAVWRVKAREAEAIRRLTVDPHSPPEFRANVVRNIDAFHEAFATTPDDGLWLDPDDRVRIW